MFHFSFNFIWVESNHRFIFTESVNFIFFFNKSKSFICCIDSEYCNFNSSFKFSFKSLEFFIFSHNILSFWKSCEIRQTSLILFKNNLSKILSIYFHMIIFIHSFWSTFLGIFSFLLIEFASLAFFCFFFLNFTSVFSKEANQIAKLIAYGIIFDRVNELHHLVFLGVIALLHHDRREAGDSIGLLDGLEFLRNFLVVNLNYIEPNLVSEFS